MSDTSDSLRNGLTYADAGVDIDAGEMLVDAIKPLAKSTRRPGAEASLGGFGALFDLKAAGFEDPLIVATTARPCPAVSGPSGRGRHHHRSRLLGSALERLFPDPQGRRKVGPVVGR
jgi:hypothetical protein